MNAAPWPPERDAEAIAFAEWLEAEKYGGRADVLAWFRWGSEWRMHMANNSSDGEARRRISVNIDEIRAGKPTTVWAAGPFDLPWSPEMDAEVEGVAEKARQLFSEHGHALDHLGRVRWFSDYRLHRAQGLNADAAWKRIERDIKAVWGIVEPAPEHPAPTPLRVEANARWFANTAGRFDWREYSAFGLLGLILKGQRDRAVAFIRLMAGYGFNMPRVLITLDGEYWKSLRSSPDMLGYETHLVDLVRLCAAEGQYIRVCLIGDLMPFGGVPDWASRRDIFHGGVDTRAAAFCERAASVLKDEPNVVFDLINEPFQIGARDSLDKFPAIGERIKRAAPGILLSGGSPDGNVDQETRLIRPPFDYCDAHVERMTGCGGFEWVKRTGEYMPIDQPLAFDDGRSTGIQKKMPFDNGEPINFGEARADGAGYSQVERSHVVAFCAAAVSRARQYVSCFHYDGGLWCTDPKPDTVTCIESWMAGLDAFPMHTDGKWRGHWEESYFKRDIYPEHDDDHTVTAHVLAGRGPWRVFGAGRYVVTIAEPAQWDFRRGLKPGANVEQVARVSDGKWASGVYRSIA